MILKIKPTFYDPYYMLGYKINLIDLLTQTYNSKDNIMRMEFARKKLYVFYMHKIISKKKMNSS